MAQIECPTITYLRRLIEDNTSSGFARHHLRLSASECFSFQQHNFQCSETSSVNGDTDFDHQSLSNIKCHEQDLFVCCLIFPLCFHWCWFYTWISPKKRKKRKKKSVGKLIVYRFHLFLTLSFLSTLNLIDTLRNGKLSSWTTVGTNGQ